MTRMKIGIANNKEFLGMVIVVMAAFVTVRYLFLPGFLPTHDGEYHLIRFYEFGRMLAAGNLFPRWAPGLNSGYGVPIFTFFYPLPNYLGSLFHFSGWSLSDSFRLTMAIGYITAIVASYFWLKRLYGVFPAIAGSIIGAFTPYWFVDIFVRGSVGEVLALGFVFTALSCIAYEKRTLLAFAIGGIILSHNIMAMIFLPILLLYAWMMDRSMLRWFFVGVMLTSYFWAPALIERGYVVGLNTVNFKDHFPEIAQLLIPSWGTGLSGLGYSLDEMSYQIGIIPLMVFLSALALLLTRMSFPRKRESSVKRLKTGSPIRSGMTHSTELLFIGTVGVAFFLMLEVSTPVWERIPILTNLQYPWRLLSVVIVATPYLAGKLMSVFRWRAIVVAISAMAVLFSFFYTKPVLYASRPDAYYLSKREFTDGTSSLGNGFSTRWMAWQPDRRQERMEIVNGEGTISIKQNSATTFAGEVVSMGKVTIRTNVAYYPGWWVAIDGKGVPAKPDARGTISVDIEKGMHNVKVYFSETPLRIVVDLVSLGCLFWLIFSTILTYAYENRNRHHSS